MEAWRAAILPMQSVKGSVIPIETINDGVAASAATLIYCGAKKRYTFPLASFILHPSAAPNIKSEWVRPNELALLKKDVEDGNKYFREVYKTCTSLSSEALDKVLYSNDSAMYLQSDEAKKTKLSQGNAFGILPAPLSYYIIDEKINPHW
ncbi:ATP-dependent Clp protease proteolytic subunit [Pantoea agglomerans]|uniref:ATP-dependent Clp protease proteolytic subunit n=1 Tax=Enterobacter agglomerans TaxID=549 RepID=UPI001A8CF60D|nr:ATP-dependent Clp protease proteolytic subunit [Pantoea agglomerans]